MRRILLAIAIVFMISSLMTQGIMVYELNALQSLVAEEEHHEEKPHKNFKDLKDTFFGSGRGSNQFVFHNGTFSSFYNNLRYSKGFSDQPFMPPDIA